MRDRETEGHTRRVTEMSIQLSRAMGMNGEDMVQLRSGSRLHDIRKMGIPDELLLKARALARTLWEIMYEHPAYAHKLLAEVPLLRSALDTPPCHHEKRDSSGYPRILACEVVPLAARIFAILDVWGALLSVLPYRPAPTRAEAKEYLRSQAGKHFPCRRSLFTAVMND